MRLPTYKPETWSPLAIAYLVTETEEVVTFASSSDPPQYSRHQGALRRTREKMKLEKLLLLQSEQDIAVSISRFFVYPLVI